ncbi:hypothetical protein J6590_027297 [Homalodisca vitripennis]|nr:hypothetical protein J6590_027297 [Homalodisca vitripennis]
MKVHQKTPEKENNGRIYLDAKHGLLCRKARACISLSRCSVQGADLLPAYYMLVCEIQVNRLLFRRGHSSGYMLHQPAFLR